MPLDKYRNNTSANNISQDVRENKYLTVLVSVDGYFFFFFSVTCLLTVMLYLSSAFAFN